MKDDQFTQLKKLILALDKRASSMDKMFMILFKRMEDGFAELKAQLDTKADKSDTDRIYDRLTALH